MLKLADVSLTRPGVERAGDDKNSPRPKPPRVAWADQVRDDREISGDEFRFAYTMSDYFNWKKGGLCNATQITLANKCDISVRGAQRFISKLVKQGHLRKRAIGGNRRMGNNYWPVFASQAEGVPSTRVLEAQPPPSRKVANVRLHTSGLSYENASNGVAANPHASAVTHVHTSGLADRTIEHEPLKGERQEKPRECEPLFDEFAQEFEDGAIEPVRGKAVKEFQRLNARQKRDAISRAHRLCGLAKIKGEDAGFADPLRILGGAARREGP